MEVSLRGRRISLLVDDLVDPQEIGQATHAGAASRSRSRRRLQKGERRRVGRTNGRHDLELNVERVFQPFDGEDGAQNPSSTSREGQSVVSEEGRPSGVVLLAQEGEFDRSWDGRRSES